MVDYTLVRKSLFASVFISLITLIASTSQLSGAIVPTGNVEPSGVWTTSTVGYIGHASDGTLTVDAGSLLSASSTYIAYNSGVTGTATLTGNGSQWTNNYSLYVGYGGTGTLNIEAGGLMDSPYGCLGYFAGASGIATVTGEGSTWTISRYPYSNYLYVGYQGTGILSIEAGGKVRNDQGFVGSQLGSSGTVTVTGAGSTWTNSSVLWVGDRGSGILNIEAGGVVSSSSCVLGCYSGSSGTVTVTGAGSTWTNSGDLHIGDSGSGVLTIEAGGQVSSSNSYLGFDSGSRGTVTVTGTGSKWTNTSNLRVGSDGVGKLTVNDGGVVTAGKLWASLRDLSGDGTILVSKGAVLDADLVFDSPYGTQATVPFGSGGTIKMTIDGTGVLGLGYKGTGSLRVSNGITVACTYGYLGVNSHSTGTATVTGVGSKWTNSSGLYVCDYGNGILIIEAGGQVSDKDGYLGSSRSFSSKGTATVTGAGSKWTNNNYLYVGYYGSGILHIRDGGMTSAGKVYNYSGSLLTIDVGYGSVLSVNNGTGSISNDGKVRFVTGPQPADGSQYLPVAAGTWSGSGTYQALGGTWDTTSHVFTVSQALAGVSGTPVAVDLAQQQRVLVGDGSLNRTVGASFLAKTGTDKIFNLTAIALADVPALGGLLQPWESVFNAWTFTAEGAGYVATDPVYLSFSVPANMSRDKVRLWKLTGDTWSAFSADDLTVTGGYASFTSTGLSGYAVTVPEPAAVVLMLTAFLGGLIVWRRRR